MDRVLRVAHFVVYRAEAEVLRGGVVYRAEPEVLRHGDVPVVTPLGTIGMHE